MAVAVVQDLMQVIKIVVDLEEVQDLVVVQEPMVLQEINPHRIQVLVVQKHNMVIQVVMLLLVQYFLVLVAVVLVVLVVMVVQVDLVLVVQLGKHLQVLMPL